MSECFRQYFIKLPPLSLNNLQQFDKCPIDMTDVNKSNPCSLTRVFSNTEVELLRKLSTPYLPRNEPKGLLCTVCFERCKTLSRLRCQHTMCLDCAKACTIRAGVKCPMCKGITPHRQSETIMPVAEKKKGIKKTKSAVTPLKKTQPEERMSNLASNVCGANQKTVATSPESQKRVQSAKSRENRVTSPVRPKYSRLNTRMKVRDSSSLLMSEAKLKSIPQSRNSADYLKNSSKKAPSPNPNQLVSQSSYGVEISVSRQTQRTLSSQLSSRRITCEQEGYTILKGANTLKPYYERVLGFQILKLAMMGDCYLIGLSKEALVYGPLPANDLYGALLTHDSHATDFTLTHQDDIIVCSASGVRQFKLAETPAPSVLLLDTLDEFKPENFTIYDKEFLAVASEANKVYVLIRTGGEILVDIYGKHIGKYEIQASVLTGLKDISSKMSLEVINKTLYICSYSQAKIYQISINGGNVQSLGSFGYDSCSHLQGPILCGKDQFSLLVADCDNNRFQLVCTATGSWTIPKLDGAFQYPEAAAIDKMRRQVYVAQKRPFRLQICSINNPVLEKSMLRVQHHNIRKLHRETPILARSNHNGFVNFRKHILQPRREMKLKRDINKLLWVGDRLWTMSSTQVTSFRFQETDVRASNSFTLESVKGKPDSTSSQSPPTTIISIASLSKFVDFPPVLKVHMTGEKMHSKVPIKARSWNKKESSYHNKIKETMSLSRNKYLDRCKKTGYKKIQEKVELNERGKHGNAQHGKPIILKNLLLNQHMGNSKSLSYDLPITEASNCGTGGTEESKCGTDGTEESKCGTGGTEESKCETDGTEESKCGTGGTEESKCEAGGMEESKCETGGTEASKPGTGGTEESKCGTGGTEESKCGTGGMEESNSRSCPGNKGTQTHEKPQKEVVEHKTTDSKDQAISRNKQAKPDTQRKLHQAKPPRDKATKEAEQNGKIILSVDDNDGHYAWEENEGEQFVDMCFTSCEDFIVATNKKLFQVNHRPKYDGESHALNILFFNGTLPPEVQDESDEIVALAATPDKVLLLVRTMETSFLKVVHYRKTGQCYKLTNETQTEIKDDSSELSMAALDDNFYICSLGNHCIYEVNSSGKVVDMHGQFGFRSPGELNCPKIVCCDRESLMIADQGNHRLQLFDMRECRWMTMKVNAERYPEFIPEGIALDGFNKHVYMTTRRPRNLVQMAVE